VRFQIHHIAETASTNQAIRTLAATTPSSGEADEALVLWADYQTAGRGCGTNRWESERAQNLLFSVLLHPAMLPARRQFHLSMAVSLAICQALGQYIGDTSIKWPNDIYWQGGKIGGILIEHTLKGQYIKDSIIGIGLNINQRQFNSDAPNPVSLWQITEQEHDREQLLNDILQRFSAIIDQNDLKAQYMSMLYRRKGYHPFVDCNGTFMAAITDVLDDGHLLLCDDTGRERRYAFKEVQFIL
jgi:BirA family biotin operon repressor/biotin-[acetyl-CoA-carboxylase] ligase